MSDYESTDEESAAHLAADHAEDDRPTLAEVMADELLVGERDDAWVAETYSARRAEEEIDALRRQEEAGAEAAYERDQETACFLCGELGHGWVTGWTDEGEPILATPCPHEDTEPGDGDDAF